MEVKKAAIDATAKLLKYASKNVESACPEEVKATYGQYTSLLKNKTTAIPAATAVQTLTTAAKIQIPTATIGDWAEELVNFLKKNDRQTREEGLRSLTSMVPGHAASIKASTYADMIKALSGESPALLNTRELHPTSLALNLLRTIASVPSQTRGVVTMAVPRILSLLSSPLAQGQVVRDAVAVFEAVCVQGVDYQQLLQLTKECMQANSNPAEANVSNLAAVVGTVLALDPDKTRKAASIQEMVKMATPGSSKAHLGLAALGEVGRNDDISSSPAFAVLEQTLTDAKRDEASRIVAANAYGRASSTSHGAKTFAKLLLGLQAGGANQALYLRALKECLASVAVGGPVPEQLHTHRDAVWKVLVGLTQTVDEPTMELLTECMGRHAQIDYNVVGMAARIVEDSKVEAVTRGAALTAMRFPYSATQVKQENENALKQHLPTLLHYLNTDSPLEMRRGAIQLLMATGYQRPQLLVLQGDAYIPALLKETATDARLVTTVDLGPFKHTVDKGLGMRKQAFDSLSNFIDGIHRTVSVLKHFNNFPAIVQVLVTAIDITKEIDLDIHTVARNMLVKLARTPEGSPAVLDEIQTIAKTLKNSLTAKPKDGQDAGKVEEATRHSCVCLLQLAEALPAVRADAEFSKVMTAAHNNANLYQYARQIVAQQ